MLEKMSDFFEARLCGYDEHMLRNIEGAGEFYPFTASLLPTDGCAEVLDLGCGTGLELEYFFETNPTASVTCIDLSAGMLSALKRKLGDKNANLVQGSYFSVPLGVERFDAAVSVESLHHFTKAEKTGLYARLWAALRKNGYFILTDYFAPDDAEEKRMRAELVRLKAEQGIADDEFYHFDTPLTVENERDALLAGGFSRVEILKNWGATYTVKAVK